MFVKKKNLNTERKGSGTPEQKLQKEGKRKIVINVVVTLFLASRIFSLLVSLSNMAVTEDFSFLDNFVSHTYPFNDHVV